MKDPAIIIAKILVFAVAIATITMGISAFVSSIRTEEPTTTDEQPEEPKEVEPSAEPEAQPAPEPEVPAKSEPEPVPAPATTLPVTGVSSTKLTRPTFTSEGGWERVATTTLTNAKNYIRTVGEGKSLAGRASMSSELCFGTVVVDLGSLMVVDAYWDDATTSVCDYVRDDHPPIPSLAYLNQYLASLGQ